MKSEEALEQIKYLKDLTEKARLSAAKDYMQYIFWGIFGIIIYFPQLILPKHYWGLTCLILLIIGIILSSVIFFNQKNKFSYSLLLKKIGLQCLFILAADSVIFGLIIYYKLFTLINPFWPFQIGIIHIIAGVHIGRDFIFIGLWMVFASIVTYFLPAFIQNIWGSVTLGGGILITGLFFRHKIISMQKGEVKNEIR